MCKILTARAIVKCESRVIHIYVHIDISVKVYSEILRKYLSYSKNKIAPWALVQFFRHAELKSNVRLDIGK